jgi:hypothetical protein
MDTSKQSLKQRALHEFREFLSIAFYLWVIFGLLIEHKSLILAEQHIDFQHQGLALVNALALGKIMLVARYLRVGDQWKNRPLILPTVVKSAFYTFVLAVFKLLEEGLVSLYHHESFQQGIAAALGPQSWKTVLIYSLLIFVMLIPFVGYGELQRALGEGKLHKLFFRTGELQAE